MKAQHTTRYLVLGLLLGAAGALPATAVETMPDSKELMRALVDEINRSMKLQMEDLEKPYFIQYTVEDSVFYHITANYGDITSSDRRRSREFFSQTRVGSYDLDNTSFSDESSPFAAFFGGGDGGGRASLPLEDDYAAIRQSIWWATDQDYKDAVETLTKKRAYMRDKNLQDRPNDFSKASIIEHIEPTATIDFDRAVWEKNLKRISAQFNKHTQVQDSKVQLLVAAGNTHIVNTEGTRLRTPDTGALLIVSTELQAEDGMKISDGLDYFGRTPQDLPPVDKIIDDIDKMVNRLSDVAEAPILERYTGPVLLDNLAAAQMFRTLLAEGVAGEVDPVGTQRRMLTGAGSLEKKLDQRILPDSFRVYDDPTVRKLGDTYLLGHYRYDDEGVQAEKVDVVVDGVLKSMVMSRVPTKKLSGSNGHARRLPGSNTVKPAIGCLFVADDKGVWNQQLKAKLIEMAKGEGLDYGLRIASVRTTGIGSSRRDLFAIFMRMQQRGGQENLGDPIYAYKVYVDDGREELVRGLEFGQIKLRDLKQIAAAGTTPAVYNYIGIGFGGATPATSIIAPPVLFEELELSKIEQEHEKLPILKTPLDR
ncbi:MAG: metallopeptidase TldD-related protein [Phycisphaerae bacterium]